MFIARIQLNYHLDFLTSTFISESSPNIRSKLNPSFHLKFAWTTVSSLQEKWSDCWHRDRMSCVAWAWPEWSNSCVILSYKRRGTYLALKAPRLQRIWCEVSICGETRRLYSISVRLGHIKDIGAYHPSNHLLTIVLCRYKQSWLWREILPRLLRQTQNPN